MGFLKLNREIAYSEIFAENDFLLVYIRLILAARIFPVNENGVGLDRGQLIISVRKFAEKNGLSYQRTRTILKKLEETQLIKISGNRSYSIITVINYDCDNEFSMAATQQATQFQRTGQRDFNAPSLFNKKIKSFQEQEPRAQEKVFSESERRARLVAEFGEGNVAEYERRFELWKNRQSRPVSVSPCDVIGKWLRADGLVKPKGSSFDAGGLVGRAADVYGLERSADHGNEYN